MLFDFNVILCSTGILFCQRHFFIIFFIFHLSSQNLSLLLLYFVLIYHLHVFNMFFSPLKILTILCNCVTLTILNLIVWHITFFHLFHISLRLTLFVSLLICILFLNRCLILHLLGII